MSKYFVNGVSLREYLNYNRPKYTKVVNRINRGETMEEAIDDTIDRTKGNQGATKGRINGLSTEARAKSIGIAPQTVRGRIKRLGKKEAIKYTLDELGIEYRKLKKVPK